MNAKFYVAVGAAVFCGNVIYNQIVEDSRITNVETAVAHIADDVETIKKIVLEQDTNNYRYTAKEFDCLARNIFYEAGTESRVGKLAVAQVTLNRVKSGYWGKNICQVVYAKDQFSWTKVKKRAWSNIKGEHWQESIDVAHQVLNYGIRVKTLKRSLWYHADYVKPNWQDPESQIAKIGKHIYYERAKGTWLKI